MSNRRKKKSDNALSREHIVITQNQIGVNLFDVQSISFEVSPCQIKFLEEIKNEKRSANF